ncbi:hypothetical protein ABPG74_006100 [Tetrahymena malaccensis]
MRQGQSNHLRVNQGSRQFQQSQSQVIQHQAKGDEGKQQQNRQQENEKPLIKSEYKDILKDLKKDITFYEFLIYLENEDKMCNKLYEISSYEQALPDLLNEEDLIIFLLLIQKLIQCIQNKQKSDSESSQQHLGILQETVNGFLTLQNLEDAIIKIFKVSVNQSSENQKQELIQDNQKPDLKDLVKYIINYLDQYQISVFQNIKNLLKISINSDTISIIKQIVEQRNNFKSLFETLEKIHLNLIKFKPSQNYQIELIQRFVEFLILKYQEVQKNRQLQRYVNLIEKCIIGCLQIQELARYLQNLAWSNNSNLQIIEFLQKIIKFEPKLNGKSIVDKYKTILYDFYSQKSDENQLFANLYFDEGLIKLIEEELNLTQSLPHYKEEINQTTNIFPNDEDCRVVKSYRGFLQKIHIKKTYMNKDEYLSNMFSFLRADSHQELVQGMNYAKELGEKINVKNIYDFNGMQKQLRALKVLNPQFNFYNQIDIVNIQFEKGLTLTLSALPILPKKNMKIRLDSSNRLLGDQCLYLTDYNFSKLITCQLENEYIDPNLKSLNTQYNNIRIKIRIMEDIEQSENNLEQIKKTIFNHTAILVEPKVYYGQYVQCMKAIKNMINNKFRLPFQENLLHLNKKINMPAFINEDTKYYLDFSPLNQTGQQYNNNQAYLHRLKDDWSQIPTLKYINQSQADAIKNILTKEISLLQGPPGTGKTYVGALAIRNILQNSKVWNPDQNVILMCCKTNHALDQFLSHIIKFEKDVVRVGGRVKLPEIEILKLSNQRKLYRLQTKSFYHCQEMENKLNKSLKYFSDHIFDCKDSKLLMQMLPKDLIKFCCKLFLKNFEEILPFLESSADQILNDENYFQLISQFWWQFNPLIDEMYEKLFSKLIDCLDENEDEKNMLKYKINMYLPLFSNKKQQDFQYLCKQYYEQKQQNVNYFYEKSNDDKSDQKTIHSKNDALSALWQRVLTFKQTPYMMENYMDEEIDDNEYVEDRVNYELDDSYDNSVKGLGESFQKNKNKSKTNSINHTPFNSLLNLTYYQFMESNFESSYQELKDQILSGDIENLNIVNEITIRLQAISEYSKQNNKDLFMFQDLLKYKTQFEMLKQEEMLNDVQIMKKKKIVAMTLGGICKYSEYLKHLKYEILLIEEAAEVLENLSVPLLQPFLKQMILIGDHQQLKPTVNSYFMEKNYNMNVSLFERLIANNLEYVCLNVQMRMAPELSEYVRLIYDKPNQYQDSDSVKKYDRHFYGFPSNVMFFMHSYDELNLNYTTTKKNEKEALLSVDLANYIVKINQFKPQEITILAMYLGQSMLIKQALNSQKNLQGIRVQTIDNYQGEENEVIILSLVRSSANHLGFVKIQNRINVSISRAKKGFIILGNKNLLTTKIPLLQKIFQKAASQNHIFEDQFSVECPQHQILLTFADSSSFSKTRDGGCDLPCFQQNLTCNHRCHYKCHYGDCDNFDCLQYCDFVFYQCGHKTKIECYKTKNNQLQCKQLIRIDNQICGHQFEIECFKCDFKNQTILPYYHDELLKKKCGKKCGKILQCYHICKQTCHQDQKYCNPLLCDEMISKQLSCGHMYQGRCGDLIKHQCKKIVTVFNYNCGHYQDKVPCFKSKINEIQCKKVLKFKKFKCGHNFEVECCKLEYENQKIKSKILNELQLKPCEVKCEKPLNCKHKCQQLCHNHNNSCDQTICNVLVNKKLDCGHHEYQDKCGNRSQYQCQKLVKVIYDKCGHYVNIPCFTSKNNKTQCEKKIQINKLNCEHHLEVDCNKLEYVNQKINDTQITQFQQKKCESICGKPLKCKHSCEQICHPSKQPCDQALCNKIIQKKLLCGCIYSGECGGLKKFKCNNNHSNKIQNFDLPPETEKEQNENQKSIQDQDEYLKQIIPIIHSDKKPEQKNETQKEYSENQKSIQDQDKYLNQIPIIQNDKTPEQKNETKKEQSENQRSIQDQDKYLNQIPIIHSYKEPEQKNDTKQEQTQNQKSIQEQDKYLNQIPIIHSNKKPEQKNQTKKQQTQNQKSIQDQDRYLNKKPNTHRYKKPEQKEIYIKKQKNALNNLEDPEQFPTLS